MTGSTGDDDFEEVFRRVLPRATRVARRILASADDAEDAAAEALARAHASWWRVGRLPHREAWILRVTANVAIDMVRRRRPLSEEKQAALEDHGDSTAVRLALVAALEALPRRQREVVVLRFLEGMSEAEVAACLRISPGTVKKATHRALGVLRRHVGDGWVDGQPVTVGELNG